MIATPDCGTWLSSSNTPVSALKSWLAGYLSGLNAAVGDAKHDPLEKLSSANQVFAWMDNYCRANPLKMVSDGGAQLYLELKNGKR